MFSIATYNVHSFYDERGQDAFDRVVEVLGETKPDILCLQEVHGFGLKKLQVALSYQHSIKWGGCAILSNLCMEEMDIPGRRARKGFYPRFLTAKLSVSDHHIYVTCCHLNHKDELKRMSELRKMKDQLELLFNAKEPQVWTGDFNSLTREDYSDEAWEDLSQVRRNNHWEMPQTKVRVATSFKFTYFPISRLLQTWLGWGLLTAGLNLVNLGLFQHAGSDVYIFIHINTIITICRFNTHIDYVFVDKAALQLWDCIKVLHHHSDASDHKLVIANFESQCFLNMS